VPPLSASFSEVHVVSETETAAVGFFTKMWFDLLVDTRLAGENVHSVHENV